MKDKVEIVHLSKFAPLRSNRDQVTDFKTWLKIHTNVSNFEAAYQDRIFQLSQI